MSGAFSSGGSQVGESFNERKSWELNNFTAKQMGTHAIKFGGRIRHVNVDDTNEGNFGGTWTFTGGFGYEYRALSTDAAVCRIRD